VNPSPPKEKPTGKGGLLRTDLDARKVARETDSSQRPELWPRNVQRLHALGIPYDWRRSSRDIALTCICGAKLVMDESRPWAWCFGVRCFAGKLKFDDLVWRLSK